MTVHVALEGIDNAGKTTVCTELAKVLEKCGRRVHVTKEFSTDYGQVLKQRLYGRTNSPSPHEKALAFALDRLLRLEALKTIDCDVVLWDRYVLSALVYRGLEGTDKQWVETINSIFLTPQLYLYIDVSPQDAQLRGETAGRVCPYSEEFLSACRKDYLNYVEMGTLQMLRANTVEEQVKEISLLIEQQKS